jgi:hypothetical protein
MGKRGKSSFFFIVHDYVGEQRNNYLGLKICLGWFSCLLLLFLCNVNCVLGLGLKNCKAKREYENKKHT